MSITLNKLLKWQERLPDHFGEEARLVRALIARHDAELRMRIKDLIATVSEREHWKLQRCLAVSRCAERVSSADLESLYEYFLKRSKQRSTSVTPDIFSNLFLTAQTNSDQVCEPERETETIKIQKQWSAPVSDLYGRMRALESRVAGAPGKSFGIQGIRIMRMIALMSKARAADIAPVRISGVQAIYRHA